MWGTYGLGNISVYTNLYTQVEVTDYLANLWQM